MEHYKYNMAECCHAGLWQNDTFGRTCLDCGFNTLHNDFGMYTDYKPIGLYTMLAKEMENYKMPHHVFSKRQRLDYLFTQLNPEE